MCVRAGEGCSFRKREGVLEELWVIRWEEQRKGMREVDTAEGGRFTVFFWTRVIIWALYQSYSRHKAGFHLFSS